MERRSLPPGSDGVPEIPETEEYGYANGLNVDVSMNEFFLRFTFTDGKGQNDVARIVTTPEIGKLVMAILHNACRNFETKHGQIRDLSDTLVSPKPKAPAASYSQ